MKSTTIATALLATIAIAQPHHGHHRRHQREHEKREIVVEWETAWVTETVIVDETGTSTIPAAVPTSEAVTTSAYSAAQFYETAAPSETPKAEPSSQTPPSPPPAPTTPTTYAAPAPPTTLIPTTKAAPTTSVVSSPPPPPVESTYVAPPTTAEAPPPAPTTVEASTAPKPQPTTYPAEGGSSAPSGGAEKKGDMTYYAPGMGSCGYDDSNPSKNVVAVSREFFQSVSSLTNAGVNQPLNPLCDKTITIQSDKGKKTTAVIRDSCPGCTLTSIDVTEGAFIEIFGSLDVGRGEVTWWINE